MVDTYKKPTLSSIPTPFGSCVHDWTRHLLPWDPILSDDPNTVGELLSATSVTNETLEMAA